MEGDPMQLPHGEIQGVQTPATLVVPAGQV
jgi:hypothetical protein